MASKPTIVLVHGIWHSPLTYAGLIAALQYKGYDVHTPFLPSCVGARPAIAGLSEDILVVRRLIEQLADLGRTVILVMHSYGGVVGCSAVDGLDVGSRAAAGKPGGVAHLVGLSAHIPPKGFGVLDLVREFGNEDLLPMAITTADDGTCLSANAKMLLLGGVPDEEAEALEKTLSWANYQCMEGKAQFEAWRHVPLTYVHTSEDMTLPAHY